jgi:hypothetical protein
MAINEEELDGEQKAALIKSYWKYFGKNALACFLYLGFLFLSNLFLVIVSSIKPIDPTAKFLLSVGTAILAIGGLRGTIQEHKDVLAEQVKKIVGHL